MKEIDTLKKENKKLKKINQNNSNLISTVVHEVRTSLSALKWSFESLQDEKENTPEQNKILFKKAQKKTGELISLINDLLAINHTEEATSQYNFKKISIIDLIEETIIEFKEEAKGKKINLVLNKERKLFSLVKADSCMLHIAFQNLIENSIKYSSKGEKVFINITQNKNFILISITDWGIGINKEDKNKIFKKFFRAENAKIKEMNGSGLGLFTVKQIILKHKGQIGFEENKPTGTKFFIKLPIC